MKKTENRKTYSKKAALLALLLIFVMALGGVSLLTRDTTVAQNDNAVAIDESQIPLADAVVALPEILDEIVEAPEADETIVADVADDTAVKLTVTIDTKPQTVKAPTQVAAPVVTEPQAPVIVEIIDEMVPVTETPELVVETNDDTGDVNVTVSGSVSAAAIQAALLRQQAQARVEAAEAEVETAAGLVATAQAEADSAKELLDAALAEQTAAAEKLAAAQEAAEAAEQLLQEKTQADNDAKAIVEAAEAALTSALEEQSKAAEAARIAQEALAAAQADTLSAKSSVEAAEADLAAAKNEAKVCLAIQTVVDAIATTTPDPAAANLETLYAKTWDEYFTKVNSSLNSAGGNYAPTLNNVLNSADVVPEGQSHTYRVYKANGQYNVFYVLESVAELGAGSKVEFVYKYDAVNDKYYMGQSVVNTDTEGNLTLSGGDFVAYTVDGDQTNWAKSALEAVANAEAALVDTKAALEQAETDESDAQTELNNKQEIAADADTAASDAQTELNTALESAKTTAEEAEAAQTQSEEKAQELEAAELEKGQADEAVTNAQTNADNANASLDEANDTLTGAQETLDQAQEELNNL